MEDLLTNAFQSGNVTAIIAAAVVYAIVYLQRRDTKSKRDEANENLDKRVSLLEQKAQQIDELDLATKSAQIQTDLQWIKDKLK